MKFCKKCGAINSDDRFFCVDCNEKLGDQLSSADEEKARKGIRGKMEKMYNRRDPLYVGVVEKIMGIISLAGILCYLLLIPIGKITQREFNSIGVGIFVLLIAAVEALFPKFGWALQKLSWRLHARNVDDLEPTSFYMFMSKSLLVLLMAIGLVGLAVNLLDFQYPPVRKYITEIAATESVATSEEPQDYIDANPEKWEEIIRTKGYAEEIFLKDLVQSERTDMKDQLMMEAIIEITGREELLDRSKQDFILLYETYDGEGAE